MAAFAIEQHERGLAKFLLPQHRPRFTHALADEKLRDKLRGQLPHFHWLDERYVTAARAGEAAETARKLQDEGAPPTCLLIHEDSDFDGLVLPLEDALGLTLHSTQGALISCVPGKLAVYFEEEPKEIFVLRRG